MGTNPSSEFPRIECCTYLEAGGSPQFFKLVDPYEHPEGFWREDSYWRHVHEAHWLGCVSVRGRLEEYLRGALPLRPDLRIMLHLGDCKDCHRRVLGMVSTRGNSPPRE